MASDKSTIRYQMFPRNMRTPERLLAVVTCFQAIHSDVDSAVHEHSSDVVLSKLAPGLRARDWTIERGKAKEDKIAVPALFGLNDSLDKQFLVDGVSQDGTAVLEVEAGRGVTNHQFLKDLFEACMMSDVEWLVLAVRNEYRRGDDFGKVRTFFETLYVSGRLQLPLRGILVIGY